MGYDQNGLARVVAETGAQASRRFEEIRIANPFVRTKPNWYELPATAHIVRPTDVQLQVLRTLLEHHTPPGPRYIDLLTEIWMRGHEVYVVGGTVRDVLAGRVSKDVDVITTMPLQRILVLARSMYGQKTSGNPMAGFLRIGGSPASGDPFIDVKVFCDDFHNGPDAIFGSSLLTDSHHRDFACNAVYFDPVNGALIDPTGLGIDDANKSNLKPICQSDDLKQHGHIIIRTAKFVARGFQIKQETAEKVLDTYGPGLSALKTSERIRYVKAQVLSKSPTSSRKQALEEFKNALDKLGWNGLWDKYFADVEQELI